MSATPPNPRYERKFVPAGRSLAEVLATVRQHPAAFREAFRPRVVNNVYLDTSSLRDYHDHVAGVSNRSKTRVRWYGTPNGAPLHPVLERKLKRGLVSGKLSFPIPAFSIIGSCSRRQIRELCKADGIPEFERYSLLGLEPTLYNRYLRHYFVSADGHFRLTVDCDLHFGQVKEEGGHGEASRCLPCGASIVELKFEPPYADLADQVTNRFCFRIARCSKYVLGLQHSRGRFGPA